MNAKFNEKFGNLWSGMLILEFGMRQYLAVKEGKLLSFGNLLSSNPKALEKVDLPSSFREQRYFLGLVKEFEKKSQIRVDPEIKKMRNIIAHGFLGSTDDDHIQILKIDGNKTPPTREHQVFSIVFMDTLGKKIVALRDEIMKATESA